MTVGDGDGGSDGTGAGPSDGAGSGTADGTAEGITVNEGDEVGPMLGLRVATTTDTDPTITVASTEADTAALNCPSVSDVSTADDTEAALSTVATASKVTVQVITLSHRDTAGEADSSSPNRSLSESLSPPLDKAARREEGKWLKLSADAPPSSLSDTDGISAVSSSSRRRRIFRAAPQVPHARGHAS